jgi:putative heme iron utilization protein
VLTVQEPRTCLEPGHDRRGESLIFLELEAEHVSALAADTRQAVLFLTPAAAWSRRAEVASSVTA